MVQLMYVEKLDITNFRNYARQSVTLQNGVNVFTGSNGMGKTNLLEAVYFSSIGRSPRTARDTELIKWNENRARISVTCQKDIGDEQVEIILSKSEKKRVLVNGMPVSRMGELMGVVATVFFSPTELKIVQGAPSERRSFMDIAICQLSKAYFYLLTRYQKVLSQRNKLLKNERLSLEALDIWDAQLAQEGAKVIKNRKGFVKNLAPLALESHTYLTDNKEELLLSYEGLHGETLEEIQSEFLLALKKDRPKDLKLKFTHTGPHKDDLSLKIGAVDLRTFGSQGQQRTTALSLKLAELQLAKLQKGNIPVLLLDDVLSELDIFRQTKLLTRVQGFQTLITCTHLEPAVRDLLGGKITEYKVHEGNVVG